MINPERRTITPFEPSSDVCQTLTASLEARQPPYLGSIVDQRVTARRPPYLGSMDDTESVLHYIESQKGGDGVFLSDGAYCVEDPYGTWDTLQESKPWFRMNFERPNESHAESIRIVGNCIVCGIGFARRNQNLYDVRLTAEELAERVHWHSPAPQQTASA
jgi:hypothetical protein